jgi:ATP-dependent DNA helicase PIF1
VVLQILTQDLKRGLGENKVGVTGSTGIAARNLRGQTLHSWAGIGTGEADVSTLVRRLPRAARARWSNTEVARVYPHTYVLIVRVCV